jgi:hypothetical protein
VGTSQGKGRVFFFLKKKEAKKTLSVRTRPPVQAQRKRGKVFWFFFSKKNALS